MKYKSLGLLIINLMIICLFTIGFASWVIVGPAQLDSNEGSFSSDNIIDNRNWISFDTKETLEFSFNDFTSDNDGKKNKIKTDITANIKEIREYYGKVVDGVKTLSALRIDLKLTYNSETQTNLDFFQYGTAAINNLTNGISITGSGGAVNKSITLPVTISGLTALVDTVSFEVVYEFNNVPQEFFKSIDSPIRKANAFYIGATIFVLE